MHVYVQKSTTTTFPRRPSASRGGELSHSVAPPSEGNCPSIGSSPLRPINRSISHLPSSVRIHLGDGVCECLRGLFPLSLAQRSDLNAARISSEKSSGCSHAAKVPTFGEPVEMDQVGIGALRPAA